MLAVGGWTIRDIAREVLEPLSVAITNRHAESSVRATVISFRGQAEAVGEVMGGLLLGTLAQLASVPWALMGSAATENLPTKEPPNSMRNPISAVGIRINFVWVRRCDRGRLPTGLRWTRLRGPAARRRTVNPRLRGSSPGLPSWTGPGCPPRALG